MLCLILMYYPYMEGYQQSVNTNKPLVVFVGHIPATEVQGVIHAMSPTLEGYPAKCIVVSVPDRGSLYWKATLPITATEGEILAAMKEVVAVKATPFRQHCPT